MNKKILDFFVVPSDLSSDFGETSLYRNRLSLLVICIMIFGMELFNMARVLFWSESGLATLNNRIYFGMYCSLFVAAALYIFLAYIPSNRALKVDLAIQYVSVLFFLLWHVAINAYDLSRNADAEIGIYFTAILGISVFILMPPMLSFIMHLSAYALLMILAGNILSGGDKINITFTSIVALAVSLTNCRHYVKTISQSIEIEKMNEQLQILAQHDSLTGLLNKTAFQHCVEPFLQTEGVTLLIVDLDNFKSVNDRFGHPCGDFVLKETALSVESVFPDAIGISRIGGDEFAVFLEKADKEYLEKAASNLIRTVSLITWHGFNVGAGCSIGGCQVEQKGTSFERLYTETDKALYDAKKQGKGRFCLLSLQ